MLTKNKSCMNYVNTTPIVSLLGCCEVVAGAWQHGHNILTVMELIDYFVQDP